MNTNIRVGIIASLVVIAIILYFSYRQRSPELEIAQPVASAQFMCDAGKTITSEFFEGKPATVLPGQRPSPSGSVVIVLSDGRTLKLTETISADGARYANTDETVIFWNKGRGVIFSEKDIQTYSGCIEVVKDPGGLPQVYESGAEGVSVRFPVGYIVDSKYRYQALGPNREIPGIKFTIPASYATGTNLSADSYISIEQIPNLETCDATLFLPHAVAKEITEGGMTYSFSSSTDAGAGNRYEETIYAFSSMKSCIAVRYFIHYGAFENYPEGAVKEFDDKALRAVFDSIRRTLVIAQ